MEKTSEILSELQSISPFLASVDKINVFGTSEDYFERLDKRVLVTVLLDQNKKNEIQKVPEEYFDELSASILSKIRNAENDEDEIKNIPSLLFSLKGKNVFTVPEYYFKSLKDNISDKIKNKKTTVISINPVEKWWKYAAAAAVASVITIGSLQFFNKQPVKEGGDTFSTASANLPDYIKLSFQYKTAEQLDNGIASLSDADIVNYLQQHGNVLDDDLITKNIDAKELPDAEDYLINDNTLNNFLKSDSTNVQNK